MGSEMCIRDSPLDKSLVAKETTRYSKGSFEKAERILGWRPHTDMESLVKKVTLEIENV